MGCGWAAVHACAATEGHCRCRMLLMYAAVSSACNKQCTPLASWAPCSRPPALPLPHSAASCRRRRLSRQCCQPSRQTASPLSPQVHTQRTPGFGPVALCRPCRLQGPVARAGCQLQRSLDLARQQPHLPAVAAPNRRPHPMRGGSACVAAVCWRACNALMHAACLPAHLPCVQAARTLTFACWERAGPSSCRLQTRGGPCPRQRGWRSWGRECLR